MWTRTTTVPRKRSSGAADPTPESGSPRRPSRCGPASEPPAYDDRGRPPPSRDTVPVARPLGNDPSPAVSDPSTWTAPDRPGDLSGPPPGARGRPRPPPWPEPASWPDAGRSDRPHAEIVHAHEDVGMPPNSSMLSGKDLAFSPILPQLRQITVFSSAPRRFLPGHITQSHITPEFTAALCQGFPPETRLLPSRNSKKKHKKSSRGKGKSFYKNISRGEKIADHATLLSHFPRFLAAMKHAPGCTAHERDPSMTSPDRDEISRQNSRRSTGPKSEIGKSPSEVQRPQARFDRPSSRSCRKRIRLPFAERMMRNG